MDQRTRPSTPLAMLARAIAQVARARSRDEVVETIRSSARSLIGCEGIAIVLRDGDLCHYVEEDAIGPLWKGQRFPATRCVSGWAMINRQTAVITDIERDSRIARDFYRDTFVRALAIAPLPADNPVAAIGAYWSQVYTPADWEIETLEALAAAAATAFENADLIASLRISETPSPALVTGDFAADVEKVAGIAAVPTILDVVLRMTGMGFAAVARVTQTRWVACQVLDPVGFGVTVGGELPIESTLCNEIRDSKQVIAFDDAAEDERYRNHHTPRIYGLRSYISQPIVLENGDVWGTLCAIDPNPAKVDNPEILGAFQLFAELIAHHLDADTRLKSARASLKQERELAELREQFIAVLGHDLRSPIAALDSVTTRLLNDGWTDRSPRVLQLMKGSISRMSGLIENLMDLARARLGGGIALSLTDCDLGATLQHVVDEIHISHPNRNITVDLDLPDSLRADPLRLAQMVANLLSNAVTHGTVSVPIRLSARVANSVLMISVSNGGKPIPPEQFEQLFLPFRRGDAKASSHGLGLGLYIASQIAEAHDGRIDVRSNERETRFTFAMPLISTGNS